jgi:hypothetical protein
MDMPAQIDSLRREVLALRRLVIESRRELGPLKGVETVEEFRKHWPTLKTTDQGRGWIGEWIVLAVTRGWITTETFDKIWDATNEITD